MPNPHRITNFSEYEAAYQKSVEQPEAFWDNIAHSFRWHRKWDKTLEWNFIDHDVKWFVGGELNISENCLDRHLPHRANQPAIIWEPNDPNEEHRTLSYAELHTEVCRFANVLKNNGIGKGDRVCLYMPMTPEAAIAMLACTRIGAVHSVVFAGFSAQSLADRIEDAHCKLLITADGLYRGNKHLGLKDIADQALQTASSVERVIVLRRSGIACAMQQGRDVWWHDECSSAPSFCPAETMSSEDTLFVLYTSGSTGKPKGVVHTTAGYMVYTWYTFLNVFQYDEGDVHWCTADVGWVTGHSYIVYGPLLNGATSIMFEGIPTYPAPDRFWQVCEKHQVTHFYTAPTAIRALMAEGMQYPDTYTLQTLKVLGSVGEPINEEAWEWYHHHVGKGRCPVVDTWWQTETGGIMISALAHITPLKPAFASLPLPGIQPVLIDTAGKEILENGVEGLLCIKFPWPSVIRTTFGDHERCRQTYFGAYPGLYFTGDGSRRDENGYYRIIGRVDDVINVSGHRLGTAEVENAIDEHPLVVESAVVGYPHDIKGQGIFAYIICANAPQDLNTFYNEVRQTVTRVIGAIAKPDKMLIVRGLPKTRSGKIMRRILRKVAEGDTSNLGDTSTLLDATVVDDIVRSAANAK